MNELSLTESIIEKAGKSYLLELPDISDRVGSNGPGDGKRIMEVVA